MTAQLKAAKSNLKQESKFPVRRRSQTIILKMKILRVTKHSMKVTIALNPSVTVERKMDSLLMRVMVSWSLKMA